MTDRVTPSLGGDSDPLQVATIIKNAGANDPGWVVASGEEVLAANDAALSGAPFGGFTSSHSASSLTVTIDTGEAFVHGAWVARDVTTDVSLDASTTGQTVYLGWDKDNGDTAIIGKSGAFGANDPKLPIHTYDTDSSGVTAHTDDRTVGFGIRAKFEGQDGSTMGQLGLLGAAASYAGALGQSQSEVVRAPGATSDLLVTVNDGSGAANLAYNCYFDGSWRYIVGSEPAYRLEFGGTATTLHAAPGGTADNAISFASFAVDDTGDLFQDGTKLWEAGNSTVPQTVLGGPPSSLSTYPLPAGDIDDGSGSTLDSDTVDGYHASDLQGGQWTTVDTYEDTDASTQFSYDSGTLGTTYDLYRVDVVWVNHHSDAAYITCQLQNDATSNYQGLYIEDSSEVYRGTNSEWQSMAKVGPNEVGQGHYRIRGSPASGADSTTTDYPTISGDFGGAPQHPHLVSGQLHVEYDTVDRISLYSSVTGSAVNGTGKVKILGMSL
jgi:hypothetical protein